MNSNVKTFCITLKWQKRNTDPTFYSYFGCFRDISSVIPGMAGVEAHVSRSSIVDEQARHSVFIFLHHIVSLVIIPGVFGPWVARGGALQPRSRTNINFRIFKLNYRRWWVCKTTRVKQCKREHQSVVHAKAAAVMNFIKLTHIEQ